MKRVSKEDIGLLGGGGVGRGPLAPSGCSDKGGLGGAFGLPKKEHAAGEEKLSVFFGIGLGCWHV